MTAQERIVQQSVQRVDVQAEVRSAKNAAKTRVLRKLETVPAKFAVVPMPGDRLLT